MSEFPSTRGYYRQAASRSATKRNAPASPHGFDKDEELSTDWRGHYQCRGCRRFGQDGDEYHPTGAPLLERSVQEPWPPVPQEAREIDERILGEAS